MASRKMTFILPEDLAKRFTKRVPARERSKYLVEALTDKLAQREKDLIRSCQVANEDLDVLAIEQEFDSLSDEIAEPWTDAPRR